MKRIGVRYVPETVEELGELVRETRGPIVFGVGRVHEKGWPTEFRLRNEREPREVVAAIREVGDSGDSNVGLTVIENLYAGYTIIDRSALSKFLGFEPSDQVIRVGAGCFTQDSTHVIEGEEFSPVETPVQRELATEGQCLPFAKPHLRNREDFLSDGSGHRIGRGLSLNFPHSLQTQCGSWRDWVLGMTVVLADGTIVKTGSKAVKSVAGYDVHKLMIGAYDTLGIVVDVTLRTFPLKALPEPDLTWGNAREKFKGELVPGKYVWRQRVLRSHYQDALAGVGDNLLYADNAGCTLWCWLDSQDQELPRYPGDWVVRTGCGKKNVQITDPTQIRFMKRAKQIFDPEGKLNPGEFGFL